MIRSIEDIAKYYKENINKLDIAKFQSYGSFTNEITILNTEDNNKTLSSILEMIYNTLLEMNIIHK